ncbi:MAG: hypothetical protein ACRET6_03340 [Burkholderiales bacterium]
MLKTRASILAATIFSLSFAGATPVDAAQGVARCGGNNFIGGPSNTEMQITRLALRNFNAMQPITINRLVVYNAPGLIIFDSDVSGLPAFTNGILGPANSILGPHQSSVLNSENFLPFLPQTDRPLQTFVTWSSMGPALPLGVNLAVVVRQRDPVTGAQLEERTRAGGDCEQIMRP